MAEILRNPTAKQALRMLEASRFDAIKGIVCATTGDVFIRDADCLHQKIADEAGVETWSPFDLHDLYSNGIYNLDHPALYPRIPFLKSLDVEMPQVGLVRAAQSQGGSDGR